MLGVRFYNANLFFQLLFRKSLWRSIDAEKTIYLTFDDGPTPEITPYVLDQLNHYKAKATFFNVGANVLKYPNLHQDVLNNGHTIGNHTQHHLGAWRVSLAEWLSDVAKANKLIPSNLIRPPYGELTWSLQNKLHQLGFQIVMWSFVAYDWEPKANPLIALEKMKRLKGGGHIIVMHDQPKAFKSLQVLLPSVLAHFHLLGYEFKALPYKALHLNAE